MPNTPVYDLPYPGPGDPNNVPVDIYALAARLEAVLEEIGAMKLTSGTYTPTLTIVTNLASTATHPLTWLRVGDVLTVDGRVAVTPTSAGDVTFDVSLPVPSNLTDVNYDVVGFVIPADVAGGAKSGSILANTAGDLARASFTAGTTGLQFVNLHLMYTVKA